MAQSRVAAPGHTVDRKTSNKRRGRLLEHWPRASSVYEGHLFQCSLFYVSFTLRVNLILGVYICLLS